MVRSPRATLGRTGYSCSVLWLGIITLMPLVLGCGGSGDPPATVDAKSRLMKVFELYEDYHTKNRKTPPDEKAFRDFIAKLPKQMKDQWQLGEDVDALLTSPRDGKKFGIRYGGPFDRGGSTRAVAWEETGQDGRRLVALNIGYVEEYDDDTFKQYRK